MHHYKKTSQFKCLWGFVFVTVLIAFRGSDAAFAQNGKGASTKSPVILALNAYSFNDLLLAKDSRDKQTLYSLFNLMDWCAVQKIAAVDLTGYYFPNYPEVPSDEYIAKVRDKAKNWASSLAERASATILLPLIRQSELLMWLWPKNGLKWPPSWEHRF